MNVVENYVLPPGRLNSLGKLMKPHPPKRPLWRRHSEWLSERSIAQEEVNMPPADKPSREGSDYFTEEFIRTNELSPLPEEFFRRMRMIPFSRMECQVHYNTYLQKWEWQWERVIPPWSASLHKTSEERVED